ncbi:PREDICTED: uncharacterized protein LOC104819203 [Tarenaya hassleriana]|uniref:uncharacterized protein LOC104819203 n=1 Tax=Tarenaya hassleriana TaxID=28532 RepID=UPI00053C67ED|nr:PREDICTED: uncharacterized protein LOC104819203 [Tarenaya hassleriana]XP_010547466.1 PREDICTED: uncharacterized protein LOC104819203 [Tarenaya hassleriana]
MPTFSAIALNSLLEPGASRSVENTVLSGKPPPSKPPISKLEKSKGKPLRERTVPRPQMSPALYATPEAIPLPDSPSSFPPSPYIINHKSRGPRLLKSFSEVEVSLRQKTENEENNDVDTDVKAATHRKSTSFSFPTHKATEEEHTNVVDGNPAEKNNPNGICDGSVSHQSGDAHDGELWNGKLELGRSNDGIVKSTAAKGLERDTDLPEPVMAKADRDGESEDFYDPGESVSFTSNTEVEDDAGAESSRKLATPSGEFYDAWDELSIDSGMQTSVNDIEAELRDIRLSLLMEIEKRKQVKETLDQMLAHWQKVREQLLHVGVSLPADPTTSTDSMNVTGQLRSQLEVARFVSDSISRGLTKAEVEMSMESKLEAKNFEITRLSDRLHYYEAVNREMSQRNQEAIEIARRERARRKKRKRWIWGSIATTIAIGSASLAWSYLSAGRSSSHVSKPMKDG